MWRVVMGAAISLVISLASRRASADSALVVLVRPPTQSAVVSEAITRVRGELIADGFTVSIVDSPPGSDPASLLASVDRQTGAAATLGLFLHADASSADLWVVDRLTNKTVVRSVEMTRSPSSSLPEVLARRSVELLRASLLEILVDAQKRHPEKPAPSAQASRWAAQALEPRRSRFSVAAGAQVLAGFGGVGGALMPVARGRIDVGERLGLRLTLSGLGTRPHVSAAEGSATVSQAIGLFELIGEIAPQSWVRPYVSLGAGAYYVSGEGSAAAPYQGRTAGAFAFATDLGVGIALPLTSTFAISLEGHTMLITPRPVIRFLRIETADVPNPLLAGAFTLVGRL